MVGFARHDKSRIDEEIVVIVRRVSTRIEERQMVWLDSRTVEVIRKNVLGRRRDHTILYTKS